MFAKTIIDSDAFIEMPITSQLLYFHLSMRADDDGFVNKPKSLMRMIGAKDDDIKILIVKKFIIPFESGVIVIKHWRIHNYIRKDTYTETKYKDEKRLLDTDENGAYSLPSTGRGRVVDGSLTQVRLGKVSIGKLDNDNDDATEPESDPTFAKLYQSFESELGRPLSIIESNQIIEWRKDHKDELITESLKRAVLHNAKNLGYINGILTNWESAGVRCLNDVAEEDKRREKNKKMAGVADKGKSNRKFRGSQEDVLSDEIYEVF